MACSAEAGLPVWLLGVGKHCDRRRGRGSHLCTGPGLGLAHSLGRVRGDYRGCPGLALAAAQSRSVTPIPCDRLLLWTARGRISPTLSNDQGLTLLPVSSMSVV